MTGRDTLRRTIAAQDDEVHRIVAELSALPRVHEHISGEALQARQRLMLRLQATLVRSEAARWRHLWPAARRELPDGPAVTDKVFDGRRWIEHRLEKARWYGDRDEDVNDLIDELLATIEDHLDQQREQVDRLRGACSREQLVSIGRALQRSRWLPTRPHPDLPRNRVAQAVARPLVVLADRLADRCRFAPTGA